MTIFPFWFSKPAPFCTSLLTRALNNFPAASVVSSFALTSVLEFVFALLFTPARIPALSAFGLLGSFCTFICLPTSSTSPLAMILPLTSMLPSWSDIFKVFKSKATCSLSVLCAVE